MAPSWWWPWQWGGPPGCWVPENRVDRQPRPETSGKPERQERDSRKRERKRARSERRRTAKKWRRKRRRRASKVKESYASESERSSSESEVTVDSFSEKGEEAPGQSGRACQRNQKFDDAGDSDVSGSSDESESSGESESSSESTRESDDEGGAAATSLQVFAATSRCSTRAAAAHVVEAEAGEDEDAAISQAIAEKGERWDPELKQYVRWENRTDDIAAFGDDGAHDIDDAGRLVGPDRRPVSEKQDLNDKRLRAGRFAQLTFALPVGRR